MPSTFLARSGRYLPHADRTEAAVAEAVNPETEVVAAILATEVVVVSLVTEVVVENPVTAVLPLSPVTAVVAANRATAIHVTDTGGATIVLRIPVVRVPNPRVVRVVTANGADIPIAMKDVPEVTNIIGR